MATVEVLETNQTVEISETSQTVNVQSGVPDATSLQGNQLPSNPSDGEVLRYNGTEWEHVSHGVFGDEPLSLEPSASGIPVDFKPTNIDSDAPDWHFAWETFDTNASFARNNFVGRWGFNPAPGGGRDEGGTDRIKLSYDLETFFEDPNDNIPQAEAHLDYRDENGTQYRFFSWAADRDVSGSSASMPIEASFYADKWVIYDHDDTRWLQMGEGGGRIDLPTGLTIRNEVNDSVILQGVDSGGNGKKLLKVNTNNRLEVVDLQLEINNNQIWGTSNAPLTLVSPDPANKVQIGKSSESGAKLSVLAPNNDVVELDADGIATAWRLRIGGHFDIQEVGNADTPFRIDVGSPDNAFVVRSSGKVGLGTVNPATRLDLNGGTLTAGALNINPSNTYSPSNVTTDRTFDADSTTVAELADVLGTLIQDMGYDA